MHRKSARTEGKGGRREILPAPLVLRKRACLLDAGHTAAESLNVQGDELGLGPANISWIMASMVSGLRILVPAT